MTRDPAQMRALPDGPWAYEQVARGMNLRMTDLQAALGHSQMNRLQIAESVGFRLQAAVDGVLHFQSG